MANSTFFLKSETAEERSARGHPIGQPCVFQAMGGLTGFSSLLSGMARMDASGGPMANTLTQEELDAPITENDHPVLRAHKAMIETYEKAKNKGRVLTVLPIVGGGGVCPVE